MLLGSDQNFVSRCDLSISEENMTIDKFEEICKDFYEKIFKGTIQKLMPNEPK